MQHKKKILINSIAIYVKIAINTIATLVATKIVLHELGAYEFGLYNLIAGVIVMLSFLNTALVISTQRFLSIAIGEKDDEKVITVFRSSLFLHIIVATGISILLLSLQPILIGDILNINSEYETVAHTMYDIMILSAVVTIVSIPLSALIHAYEDIYFFALSETMTGLLKLLAAIIVIYVAKEKLVIYTLMMLVAILVGALMKLAWCRIKYSTINLRPYYDKTIIREISGFIGWNTLGSSASVMRNQGLAMVFNVFFGAIINAAYGIANQVNGLINIMSATMTTVFTPTLIRSHGEGNNTKMWRIARLSSKMSFIVSGTFAIPLMIFMPEVLNYWLKEYPNITTDMCRLIFIPFIFSQMSAGFNRVIYAIGHIKKFQIVYSSIMILLIPIGYVLLKYGSQIHIVFYLMALFQLSITIVEFYFAHKLTGYPFLPVIKDCLIKPMFVFLIVMVLMNMLLRQFDYNYFITVALSMMICCIVFSILSFFLILNKEERAEFQKIISNKK